jgi:DNA invertase Pin-like site-specific DNA recombinase
VKRAALYLRVSTDEQTIENQRGDLERLVSARGWGPVFFEETASGTRDDRPELAPMMDAARRGEVTAVAVWSLSRMHRSMARTVRDVLELDRLGIAVVSHREAWLDTSGPARGLLVAIFGSRARTAAL